MGSSFRRAFVFLAPLLVVLLWQVGSSGATPPSAAAPAAGSVVPVAWLPFTARDHAPQSTTATAPAGSTTPTQTSTPEPTGTVILGLPSPTPIACDAVSTPTAAASWLAELNAYRAQSGLAPVAENAAWSCGGAKHARYLVKNDASGHAEDPANPWYSPEGAVAGQSGNVATSSSAGRDDREVIDSWIQAPFHAAGMLDPRLQISGYGSYREADGGVQSAGVLDVIRGASWAGAPASYPIMFPGHNATVALTRFRGESPDPLTSCPGYAIPAGLPLILQLGSGSITPTVTSSSFVRDGVALEHCVFDETSYRNPDPTSQQIGRQVLAARDAIVLIPRQPLAPGGRYTATITTNGAAHTWSFAVASTPRDAG